ncbi:MAG: hypothetical protein HQK84_12880 [Nitrospinae bacterium]|nr:hypothetical protein [Nitrospinota bacterium]
MNIPDDIARKVQSLPNSDEFATEAFQRMFELRRVPSKKPETGTKKRKWAQFVDDTKKKRLLSGISKEVHKTNKGFRESLEFNHDKQQ